MQTPFKRPFSMLKFDKCRGGSSWCLKDFPAHQCLIKKLNVKNMRRKIHVQYYYNFIVLFFQFANNAVWGTTLLNRWNMTCFLASRSINLRELVNKNKDVHKKRKHKQALDPVLISSWKSLLALTGLISVKEVITLLQYAISKCSCVSNENSTNMTRFS